MTNPAVEALPDGPPADLTDDGAASFLADFDNTVLGIESSFSKDSERSSEPKPDTAVASENTADAKPEKDAEPSGDPETPPPEPADIPAEPLAYTVNGQSKTVDWALKVGDEGVVIPPQFVSKLQDLIQRDEWQNAQNRELYQKTQQYEALAHKVGDQEYRGVDAFRQLQAEKAMLDASGGKVMAALADPEFVTNLALAYQSGDANQVQNVLAGVIQQVKFAGERAQFDTLRSLDQSAKQSAQVQDVTQLQETEYTQLVTDIGKALPALTPDDLKAMYDYFGTLKDRIFRPATPDEARQFNVRVGTIIRDPSLMNEWAKDRAQLRASMTTATSAAKKAAEENAARNAARTPPKNGKRPAAAPPKPAPKPGAKFEGDDGSYNAWKNRLSTGKWAHEEMQDT